MIVYNCLILKLESVHLYTGIKWCLVVCMLAFSALRRLRQEDHELRGKPTQKALIKKQT